MSEMLKLFWAQVDGLNEEKYKKIIEIFGDLESAGKNISLASLEENDFPKKSAKSLMKKINETKKNWAKIQNIYKKSGAKILFFSDKNFPKILTKISDPPLFLFYKGDIENLPKKFFAVVGSRTATQDGKFAMEKILPEIIQRGFVIVSGMASGIDTFAHQLALKHSGKTIAFWGTGIDQLYPSKNKKLAEEIEKNGVIFSEFPLGTLPLPYNFPRRNRLVSGISEGVLVVEGKKKSGSLITADFAMEQGKEVFAVPGSLRSPLSEGPHKLIQEGVKLTTCAEDILEEFGITADSQIPESNYTPQNEQEKIIYDTLSFEAMDFDLLAAKTKISSSELSSSLMMMSLQGAVEDIGNSHFVRR